MKTTKNLLCMAGLLGACATTALAQAPIAFYRSGSTGADGPFNPVITTVGTNYSLAGVPTGTKLLPSSMSGTAMFYVDVPLRTNGLYNFTTITIPKNVRVRFVLNTNQMDSPPPVIFLATGDIQIAGEISVTPKDTAAAFNGVVSANIDNGENWSSRWIPGPGGYRGGKADKEMGLGPNPGLYDGRPGGDETFCLPLVGGSGMAYNSSYGDGIGGAGVIYLASSARIIFDGDTGVTSRGIVFRGSSWDYVGGSANGMAAIFANEVIGSPRCSDIYRMLVAACRQQVIVTRSIYPMWSTGIIGHNIPNNPLVRIIQVGTNAIPDSASQLDVFQVAAPGEYPVTIETRNLGTNLTFTLYASRLGLDMKYNNSQQTYDFPPTVSVGAGICRATGQVQINSGYQYLTARAKYSITVAMAPTFQGSPIDQWRWEMDSNGKTRVMYATTSGATLSEEAAMRLALEQGKWDFIRTFGGQDVPKS